MRAWRPSRRCSTMARTTSVPPIVREERREAGPDASIPFGSPRKAEAFRGSPWIGVSKPKLRGASPGSPPGAEAPWRFTCGSPIQAEACPGSPFGSLLSAEAASSSPFGSLLRPKPWQFSRSPAPAEAFASSPSVPRVRPKPWRFAFPEIPCQPQLVGSFGRNLVPAEAGRSSRFGSPSRPKPWRFTSEAPCRPKPIGFSGLGFPSEPKPFRFSFGGSVKPKLLVPPGCSTKLAGPCKSEGASPLRPHGGGFVSRPRRDVSNLRLRSDPKPFPAAAWSFVPRGDRPGHNWNLSWESESAKPNLPVDNKDNGGRIHPWRPTRLRGSADPALGRRFGCAQDASPDAAP